MPPKIELPEEEIVSRWVSELSATTRSLAEEYDCSYATIRARLHNHLDKGTIKEIKEAKISHSASQREDHQTEEHRQFMAEISKLVPKEVRMRGLDEGSRISAEKRKGVPLSKEHREKMGGPRPHTRGEDHPNWKGGVSEYQWRKPNWREQQRKCRKRDQNECQSCGMTKQEAGQNMDVHHIVSYHEFDDPEEANKLSNLICLCRSCHRQIESDTLECPKP